MTLNRKELPPSKFEMIMVNAIDEALSSLGEKSKELIFFHLEQDFALKKSAIPSNLEIFADAIEEIFGAGAKFLEMLIMKRLTEKVGGFFRLEEAEMGDYLIAATDFSKKIMELFQKQQTDCQ